MRLQDVVAAALIQTSQVRVTDIDRVQDLWLALLAVSSLRNTYGKSARKALLKKSLENVCGHFSMISAPVSGRQYYLS